MIYRIALFSALVLLASAASAATLRGRVVAIVDGDTITILNDTNGQHKVRLAGIDAPEKAQPFSSLSKASLSSMVYSKPVTIDWSKRDRYGRIIGKVMTPEGVDASLEQIRAGFAWWYSKYKDAQSPHDQGTYEQAEHEARSARRGLWADSAPVPPWDWRRLKRL